LSLAEALAELQALTRSLATPTVGGRAGFPRAAVFVEAAEFSSK